jgi:hypothetical protein
MSFASVADKQAVTEAITGGPWTGEYRKMLARLVMNSRVGVKGTSDRADMQEATKLQCRCVCATMPNTPNRRVCR